jgi:hypothetical protein
MLQLLKYIVYICLSFIAFYFILANFNDYTASKAGMRSNGVLPTDFTGRDNGSGSGSGDDGGARDLEIYGQKILADSKQYSNELIDGLRSQMKFKKKPDAESADKNRVGLLNKFLSYVSPVETTHQKAPDLENFDDYAPRETPAQVRSSDLSLAPASKPIMATNKVVPNYLELSKLGQAPLAMNEFDNDQPANFQSERTTPFSEKISAQNISNFFQKNPFKSFDDISKSDVIDPSQWDQIVKKKEANSPLLSLDSMKQSAGGFMPSNHYENSQNYSNLS